MKNFDEYVIDWWKDYINDHQDDARQIMQDMIGESETVEDYLEDGELPTDYLLAQDDADTIYEFLFGYGNKKCYDDLPTTNLFLCEMFKQAAEDMKYSFVEEFVEDMADEAESYKHPQSFFDDLRHGGCVSGTIGMLIYHSDCKRIYIEHIDDMEDFKSELEDEMGEPVKNRDKQPHYTFMCWLCYEETAYRIAQNLFP